MTTFVCPAVQRDVKFVQLTRIGQNFRDNGVLFRVIPSVVIPQRENGAIFAVFSNLNFDPVYLLVTRKTFHLLNNKTRHTLLNSITGSSILKDYSSYTRLIRLSVCVCVLTFCTFHSNTPFRMFGQQKEHYLIFMTS